MSRDLLTPPWPCRTSHTHTPPRGRLLSHEAALPVTCLGRHTRTATAPREKAGITSCLPFILPPSVKPSPPLLSGPPLTLSIALLRQPSPPFPHQESALSLTHSLPASLPWSLVSPAPPTSSHSSHSSRLLYSLPSAPSSLPSRPPLFAVASGAIVPALTPPFALQPPPIPSSRLGIGASPTTTPCPPGGMALPLLLTPLHEVLPSCHRRCTPPTALSTPSHLSPSCGRPRRLPPNFFPGHVMRGTLPTSIVQDVTILPHDVRSLSLATPPPEGSPGLVSQRPALSDVRHSQHDVGPYLGSSDVVEQLKHRPCCI